MQTRVLGNDTVGRFTVGAIGLGAMQFLQPAAKPRDRLVATVRAAVDAGVTFIDTADAYGPNASGAAAQGQNESLLAGILDELGLRGQVVVATKGGSVRTDGGSTWSGNGTPAHLHRAVEASRQRLGVDVIDLYQHHRPDPTVPYADTLGAMREIYDAGTVRMVGISNADPDQIRQARDILGEALVSVQNQLSPAFRATLPELNLCAELGLAFLPWAPLGGPGPAADPGPEHRVFAAVARELGVSTPQVILAWLLAQAPIVIPIPGASRPESILDSAAAADLELTADQLARLDAA